MLKRLLIAFALVIFGILVIGDPLETTDNPKTIAKKVGENYQINTLETTTNTVTKQLGEQAIESGCKDPNSQWCNTTNWYVFVTSLAIAILFIGLLAGAILYGIRIILSIFE